MIGIFGLAPSTDETRLREVFSQYGALEKVELILDKQTRMSRQFAFIYFNTLEEATQAKDAMNGQSLDGRTVRVDYSTTKNPHEGKQSNSNSRDNRAPRDDRDQRDLDRPSVSPPIAQSSSSSSYPPQVSYDSDPAPSDSVGRYDQYAPENHYDAAPEDAHQAEHY